MAQTLTRTGLIARIDEIQAEHGIASPIPLTSIDDEGLEYRLGMLQRKVDPNGIKLADIDAAMGHCSMDALEIVSGG